MKGSTSRVNCALRLNNFHLLKLELNWTESTYTRCYFSIECRKWFQFNMLFETWRGRKRIGGRRQNDNVAIFEVWNLKVFLFNMKNMGLCLLPYFLPQISALNRTFPQLGILFTRIGSRILTSNSSLKTA